MRAPFASFFTLLLLFNCFAAAGQPVARDSTPVNTEPGKNFTRATLEIVGAQVLPWAWNKLYRKKDFTFVTFRSIGRNLNPSKWRWDDNTFLMNQFVHPYHGAVYFNSFRSNGYPFWSSSAAAVAGSYLWEVAGENHLAAPNDLINTSLGGIALGEIAHRLSERLIDTRQKGFIRQLREVAALLVNPPNGINRILDHQWGRAYASKTKPATPLFVEADAGSRLYKTKITVVQSGRKEFFSRLSLDYGDAHAPSRHPFSNFSASMELGTSDSATFNVARIRGTLYSWLFLRQKNFRNTASLTLNYDYYRNSAFSYGAESFHFNVLSELKTLGRTRIQAGLGGGLIALAAVPNERLHYGEGRNYDYCSGLSMLASGRLSLSERLIYRINVRQTYFWTLNGTGSIHQLRTANSEIKFYPVRKIFFAFDWGNFVLNSRFRDNVHTHRHYLYTRLSAGCRFPL